MLNTAITHFRNLLDQGMPYKDALRSTAFRFGVSAAELEQGSSRPAPRGAMHSGTVAMRRARGF